LLPLADSVISNNVHEAFHLFEKILSQKRILVLVQREVFVQELKEDHPHVGLGM
jgi:hypothetical protein